MSFPSHTLELLEVAADAASYGALANSPDAVQSLAVGDRLRLVGRLLKAVRWLVDNVDFEQWSGIVSKIIELVSKFSGGGQLTPEEWAQLVNLFLDAAKRLLGRDHEAQGSA